MTNIRRYIRANDMMFFNNPVKHGLVTEPDESEYSSFREYLKGGYYSEDWAIIERLDFNGDFGE